uniref:Uncharacterized protein n=1 Tax=Anopheles minimus TaxID=112268 RepID=A0A182VTN5_9DIPT
MRIHPNDGHIFAVMQMAIDGPDRNRMIASKRDAQSIVIQHLRHLLRRYLLDVIYQTRISDSFRTESHSLLTLAFIKRHTNDSDSLVIDLLWLDRRKGRIGRRDSRVLQQISSQGVMLGLLKKNPLPNESSLCEHSTTHVFRFESSELICPNARWED